MEVACTAGQGPIVWSISTTFGQRKDMINFKGDIENNLRSVAVLTLMGGSLSDKGIVGIHSR
jgi:hypothetical protein